MNKPQKDYYDFVVVGGGFFGCYIAVELKRQGKGTVVIVEREPDLLKRASFNNQARVHTGYHYPRSILTGLSSRINFQKFIKDFDGCIYDSFKQYYAVGKIQSKITLSQYKTFCKRIGAPLYQAPSKIKSLFNPKLIEDVFLAEECAFDAVKLKEIISSRARNMDIPLILNTEVKSVSSHNQGTALKVSMLNRIRNEASAIYGRYVFNCTYSNINTILANSGLPKLNLKQEFTEMALVKMPDDLKDKGVTIMCGDFFSFMPFPAFSLHTLSHVRYTPHHCWYDMDLDLDNQAYFDSIPKISNFLKMIQDAKRYMPLLQECKYVDSLWEIKTILPQSEIDDSRPIVYKKDAGLKDLVCIMGGKIDNVYDLQDDLDAIPNFKKEIEICR